MIQGSPGQIISGREIGKVSRARYIWIVCSICNKGRWVILSYTRSTHYTGLCRPCQAAKQNYKDGNTLLVDVSCKICGREHRVVQKRLQSKSYTGLCNTCFHKHHLRGANHPCWKGGRQQGGKNGYISITLSPDDFFYPMTDTRGRIAEHRLIMAKSLKRHLLPWEIVHHKDDNHSHNLIENLVLFKAQAAHLPSIAIRRYITKLENKVRQLETKLKEEVRKNEY